jgi:hypothetical protein
MDDMFYDSVRKRIYVAGPNRVRRWCHLRALRSRTMPWRLGLRFGVEGGSQMPDDVGRGQPVPLHSMSC